jgi:hypothetical protein
MPKVWINDEGVNPKLPPAGFVGHDRTATRWRYTRNVNPSNSSTSASFRRADGATITLHLGGTYDLTADDVDRARTSAKIELEPTT